jgi:hypothetical protein
MAFASTALTGYEEVKINLSLSKQKIMKFPFILLCILGLTFAASAQSAKPKTVVPDPSRKIETLEAACGMCQMGLKGEDCALAVRVNGKAYYVDGTNIDSHGDAHAKDGFCNMIRKAEVQGALEGDKYKVTYFKLLPASTTAVPKQ